MAIKLKSDYQISRMRHAGAVVHEVLEHLRSITKPGVSTGLLEREADRKIRELGGESLFRGVPNPRAGYPFPACICTSVDYEVVHGIPSDQRILNEGQIVSIDCGVRINGYCGDAAVTLSVGRIAAKLQKLIDVTRGALEIAIAEIRSDVKWSQVAAKMQAHVEKAGFSVVTIFVGHGIGSEMHEDPKVPNFVSRDLLRNDIALAPGMVLAIEPMVNMGGPDVDYAPDGWTVVTQDRQPSAHFEHTVAVRKNGAEILTNGS